MIRRVNQRNVRVRGLEGTTGGDRQREGQEEIGGGAVKKRSSERVPGRGHQKEY